LTGGDAMIGAVLPNQHLGRSVETLRSWVDAARDAGYAFVATNDHVLGADLDSYPEALARWPHPPGTLRPPYDYRDEFHEPLVLLGYVAALCDLELVTAVLVLPQRQAQLVAKQVAELDILSGGRVRVAVAAGWNEPEFANMGAPFARRGRLLEEQVAVLRGLWSQELFDLDGAFHRLRRVGISPRPLRADIPLWMGGGTALWRGLDANVTVLRRIGRLADGWYLDPRSVPGPLLAGAVEVVRAAAADAGRDPDRIGLDGRLCVDTGTPEGDIATALEAWLSFGATHVSVDTSAGGVVAFDDHVAVLRRVGEIARKVTGT
jgi:probable F420-dependent oxidoreductase